MRNKNIIHSTILLGTEIKKQKSSAVLFFVAIDSYRCGRYQFRLRTVPKMILILASALVSMVSSNNAPYYGVPVGSLFNSVDGTQGEIYASDSKTLTVVHFHHNAQPGCN